MSASSESNDGSREDYSSCRNRPKNGVDGYGLRSVEASQSQARPDLVVLQRSAGNRNESIDGE